MAVFRFRCSLYTVLGWLHERNDADAGWILLRLARVCQWARDDLRTIQLLQIPLVGFNRQPHLLQHHHLVLGDARNVGVEGGRVHRA